jgi:ATP-dependent DNA helicase DinG
VAAVFASGGPLARAFPAYETRSGQLDMATAVAAVLETGGVLLAEAGTGTGKTLAYLIPAMLSGQRVLISTGTKNLQEQIYLKDLPALREVLGVPVTATCMKGRANYLCLHRLDQLSQAPGASGLDGETFLPVLSDWAGRTETGDRAELDDLPEELPFWNEVSAAAETCLGTTCPRYDECFVTLMRQRAAVSDLVIVNHHLLCADAAVRQSAYGEVIPPVAHAVLDEAHQLEEVATQYFGMSVSTYRVEGLARDLERLVARAVDRPEDREPLERAIEQLRMQAREFFADLAAAHDPGGAAPERGGRWGASRPREERTRATDASIDPAREAAARVIGALQVVDAALASLEEPRSDSEMQAIEEVQALARRSRELADELRFLLRVGDPDYVYFVERRGRGVFLRAAPIDVSSIVRELLLDRMRTTVLTSATLAVEGTFGYVRQRLGIRQAAEIRLPSEFDFARQAILYLPPHLPDPRTPEFVRAAGREVIEILRRTRGRAFVLCTSHGALQAMYAMASLALDYPLLMQGTAPRTQLLDRFRATPHAVLFATSAFWQGVDVVGDALSCVIVDKLPFASPTDPITGARIDAIRARGGEPFDEYQVPLAMLTLQQGLGRLIRHRSDRGVLAILDPRLHTRGYGRRFIASLPPAAVVDELAAVEAFFSIV